MTNAYPEILARLTSGSTRGTAFLNDVRSGSALVWRTILAMALLALLCLALQIFDDRLLNGISVWDKPAKFFAALAIQFATVSWGLSMLPQGEREGRAISWSMIVMVGAGWFEMAYIVFRAARAEPSHFNFSSPLSEALYSLMGLGAVAMTSVAFFVGYRLWRHRQTGLWTEAAALGLMFGAVLGTIAGAYMSANAGHWVGGELSDANGLGFFAWSTTRGDLRVAHFVGLHAAQIIPFAALSGRRSIVWTVAGLVSLVTVGVFMQAAMGMPLLRL